MRSASAGALLLGAALVTAAGCGCPPGTKPQPIVAGAYRYPGPSARADGKPAPTFPVSGIPGKRMLIDRDAGTVTVSYAVSGKAYVETWRMKRISWFE